MYKDIAASIVKIIKLCDLFVLSNFSTLIRTNVL